MFPAARLYSQSFSQSPRGCFLPENRSLGNVDWLMRHSTSIKRKRGIPGPWKSRTADFEWDFNSSRTSCIFQLKKVPCAHYRTIGDLGEKRVEKCKEKHKSHLQCHHPAKAVYFQSIITRMTDTYISTYHVPLYFHTLCIYSITQSSQ